MNQFYATFAIMLLALTSLLQGCAPASNQPTEPAAQLVRLQVGYIPLLGYSPIYLALEKGYFAEEGLEVELQAFNSGANMIAPLSTGQLDVGNGEGGTAFFNAIHQELDIMAVASLASMPPGYGANPILVRKDLYDSGEITEVADLKGRKIVVNVQRGIAEYLIAELLAKAGLTVDDVELVAIPFPDVPAAFANRAIDAGLVSYPAAGKAIKDGSAVVLVKGDEITDSPQVTLVYFGQRLLDPANRDLAVRYLKAYLRAARELDGQDWKTEENLAIINKFTEVPIPVIEGSVMPHFDPNGDLNLDSLGKTQDYLVSRGYTEYDTQMDLGKVVDFSYTQEAIKQLGKIEP